MTAITADPEEERVGALSDEFEDASPSNQYLTKKDFKRILLGLVLLAVVCYPLYKKLNDDRMRYICAQNFMAISTAMNSYVEDNEGLFPPTFLPDSDTGLPRLDDKGRPYTWASTLADLSGFDVAKHSFSCPAADPSEVMNAGGPKGVDLPMSYGMYAAYGMAAKNGVSNAARAVLISETANDGAEKTYDPHPMSATAGSVHDNFLIGWSTGDFTVPPAGKAPPPSVTRVAFPDSATGLTRDLFKGGRIPQGRHDDSVYVLFVDGHCRLMKAGALMNPDSWDIPAR